MKQLVCIFTKDKNTDARGWRRWWWLDGKKCVLLPAGRLGGGLWNTDVYPEMETNCVPRTRFMKSRNAPNKQAIGHRKHDDDIGGDVWMTVELVVTLQYWLLKRYLGVVCCMFVGFCEGVTFEGRVIGQECGDVLIPAGRRLWLASILWKQTTESLSFKLNFFEHLF